MKSFKFLIISIVIGIVFLGLAGDLIAKFIVLRGIKSFTGLEVSIKQFKFNPIKQSIDIDEAVIYNPAGFSDRLMANFTKIKIDYDLKSLLRGNIHFHKLTLNLANFIIVKDRNGKFNVDSLKSVKFKKELKGKKKIKKEIKKIKIDLLNLKIKQVIFKNYLSYPPEIKTFNLNIDESLRDIEDGYTLVNGIVARALYNKTLENFLDLRLNDILPDLADILKKTTGLSLELTDKGIDSLNYIGGTIITEIKDIIRKTTEQGE